MIPIHPDDILLFTQVTKAMRLVAAKYELPLRNIEGYPMPKTGMADRLGDCAWTGNIRLVLRCIENGEWCDEPLSPDTVWDTAAHELAHLRFMNHGPEFQDFCDELKMAMKNQREDHRQKILQKLIKLQNSRQGEAELGNSEAAEAFAAMINKMLIDYELQPSDVDFARAADDDPVIEIRVDLPKYLIEESRVRVAWQENLAATIASAHLCQILVRPNSNHIWFVGVRSHATVAEFVYGTMVPLISKISKTAEVKYWRETGCGRGRNNMALGYRAAWIDGFTHRIWQRFYQAREAAVQERVANAGISKETALVRLDGALVKVRKYIEDKFSHHRAARSASSLSHRYHAHAEGRAAGRAAADAIELGRRGISGNTPRKMLGD